MNFLHIIGTMNPRGGGPSQFIRNLAPCFDELGHTMEIVCLDDPRSAYLSGESLAIRAMGAGRGAWNYHPRLWPWLREHLSRFDAVFLNGLWQYPGFALSRVTQRGPAPGYFIFPHGMLDPWFQKVSVRPRKALRNWLYWKFVEHRVVNQARGLLFTCAEERRLARLPFRPYSPQREWVVGLGVPDPPPNHQRMQVAFEKMCPGLAERRYFLFLGRIHPKKAIDLVIKAYATICRMRTTENLPVPGLIIAGPDGETAYGQAMRKLGSEICPPDSIGWPGMLTGDSKWGALYGCEAFVLPSHQENFGIAVVEALACGRPVLISNQVNIWREIEESGAALVANDDLAGTTSLFQRWLKLSASTKAAVAGRAKFCFEDCFSGAKAAHNLLNAVSASISAGTQSHDLKFNQI